MSHVEHLANISRMNPYSEDFKFNTIRNLAFVEVDYNLSSELIEHALLCKSINEPDPKHIFTIYAYMCCTDVAIILHT